MRLSADSNSADYWRHQMARAPSVVLDGRVEPKVVAADDIEGWIERLATNEQGELLVRGDDEVVVERVYGRVAIVPFPL